MTETLRHPAAVATEQGVLATNKVLRNAYILLSMSLLVAAGACFAAVSSNAKPVHWLIFLAVFMGGPFAIQAIARTFWSFPAMLVFSGAVGWMIGPLVGFYLKSMPNGPSVVMNALVGTGVVFVAMSAYAITTKRDFSAMRGFLFTGLIVVLLAIVANLFMQIPMLSLAISGAAVLLMSGLILYRTSEAVHGGEDSYVMLAIDLFTSIVTLFVHLLRIFGVLGGDD